jgi:glycosyltransferase involved in cell wall biosynthesis
LPRLLIINQYFASREATGQLLLELTEHLADEFAVTVVAEPPSALADETVAPDPRLTVVRVPAASFSRSSLLGRAANYASFLTRLPLSAWRTGPTDVVFCLTDPPVVGLGALAIAKLRGAPLVLGCQDVHPQLGQVTGLLDQRVIFAVLRRAQRVLLSRADHVVAIGHKMGRVLVGLGADEDRVRVIPNWTDTALIRPAPRPTAWAREHALDGHFVVMHAGNVGQLQGLETALEAARRLPQIRLLIVGDGSGRPALMELAARRGITNVRFVPWQPHNRMGEVLSSADAQLVCLMPGLAGLLEPSKFYGVLAAGTPVLVALDDDSEGAIVARRERCGVAVAPGDAEALADAIAGLAALPDAERAAMGERGRVYAELHGDRRAAAAAYADLFRSVLRLSAARRS